MLAQAAQSRRGQVPGQLLLAMNPVRVSGNHVERLGRDRDEHFELMHFPGRKGRMTRTPDSHRQQAENQFPGHGVSPSRRVFCCFHLPPA
ncbi:hypothetical protein D3C86_1970400 [compost metagenome]